MTNGPFAGAVRPPALRGHPGGRGALGDAAKVREGIARMWCLVAAGNEVKILWDLAVREAKDLGRRGAAGGGAGRPGAMVGRRRDARAGHLRHALHGGLPGGGRARAGRAAASTAHRRRPGGSRCNCWTSRCGRRAPARPRPPGRCCRPMPASSPTRRWTPWRDFALGILAVRDRQPGALERLTPWMEARIAQASAGPAVWPFLGIGAGWWALAPAPGRPHGRRAGRGGEHPTLADDTRERTARGRVEGRRVAGGGRPGAHAAAPRPSPEAQRAGMQADHGVFQTLSVRRRERAAAGRSPAARIRAGRPALPLPHRRCSRPGGAAGEPGAARGRRPGRPCRVA